MSSTRMSRKATSRSPRADRSVRLAALWDALHKRPPTSWGDELDLEGWLLGPILAVTDGAQFKPLAKEQRFRDAWRNAQLPRAVGALFQALGERKDGEGTLRHIISSSNQIVAFYASKGGRPAAALLNSQATLIKEVLGERALTLGKKLAAVISEAPVRAADESPARIKLADVRTRHMEEARKRRTGHARDGDAADCALPGSGSIDDGAPSSSAGAATPTPQRSESGTGRKGASTGLPSPTPPGAAPDKAAQSQLQKAASDKALARRAPLPRRKGGGRRHYLPSQTTLGGKVRGEGAGALPPRHHRPSY